MLIRVVMLSLLTGCPWVGEGRYEDVRDGDGDGEFSVRFGGQDCLDDDPSISDCDVDGDGFVDAALPDGDDCDDTDDSVFPGAPEVCDGADNDCNGATDNDDPAVISDTVAYLDADGDGDGDPRRSRACAEAGDVDNALDCDDADPAVHSRAEERCDAIDNDCDGTIDDAGIWNADTDGDGFGDPEVQSSGSCQIGPDDALAANGDDCNDTDAAIHPDAFEVAYDGVDSNCNGLRDEWDADLDAHVPHEHWAAADAANQAQPPADRWPLIDGDCDDLSPLRFFGNPEVCDGVDNDCDEAIDADDPNPGPELLAELTHVFLDADGDGAPGTPTTLCPTAIDPAVHSFVSTDCDDTDPHASPDQPEICDGADNDCDGRTDWSLAAFVGSTSWFRDADGDQYGDAPVQACAPDAFEGLVAIDGDCNDGDASTYPGATEICGDAVRQDCSTVSPWDCDSDGQEGSYFGNGSGEDCDDERDDVYATDAPLFELCDGIDNDCDGLIDIDDPHNLDLTHETTWYTDADGDGFGDLLLPGLTQCNSPGAQWSPNAEDCDDSDATRHPDTQWYEDLDEDGYGNATVLGVIDCVRPVGSWAARPGDCNDLDPDRHPDAIWRPDLDGDGVGDPTGDLQACLPPAGYVPAAAGIDCDDDDEQATGGTTWYLDEDGDGHGNQANVVVACTQPSGGFVANATDCDDRDPTRNPDRPEVCNGIDDDCDGLADDDDDDALGLGPEGFIDQDGDGFGLSGTGRRFCLTVAPGWSTQDGDCNDIDPLVSPGATEICGNGIDEDCTGDEEPPLWFSDIDGDGFGSGAASAASCDPPDLLHTWANNDLDCDDAHPDIFPGAVEPDACDAIDHDCDGTAELRLTWFPDQDLDGFGDDHLAEDTCNPPVDPGTSWILRGGDCDDMDASVDFGRIWFDDLDGDERGDSTRTTIACGPDPVEGEAQSIWLVDDLNGNQSFDPGDLQRSVFAGDCDDSDPSVGSARAYHTDADGDGFGSIHLGLTTLCPALGGVAPAGYVTTGGDCVDAPADATHGEVPIEVSPAAAEDLSDGIDNNCDGLVDLPSGGVIWYVDGDGDGLGGAVSVDGFVHGAVTNDADCDDTDNTIGSTQLAWRDLDGDGHGAGAVIVVADCTALPADGELVNNGDDCDDANVDVPALEELCNGIDDDCDGLVPPQEVLRYLDRDEDGEGAGDGFYDCTATHGVDNADDCDDHDTLVNTGAVEACNGIDDNCDGVADEHVQTEVFPDVDGDGFGVVPSVPILVCGHPPPGHVDNAHDCDDTDADVHPDFWTEICGDSLDNDCDGQTDDHGVGYRDGDSDGEVSLLPSAGVCTGLGPLPGPDCNDLDPHVNTSAEDLCDDIDSNCDGEVDDAVAQITTYYDGDGDQYGTGAQGARISCVHLVDWVEAAGDCDDEDPLTYPGAHERCNGRDDDCTGAAEDEVDHDGDGYRSCFGTEDCDDGNVFANPGMPFELCDGVDNDCDGAMISDGTTSSVDVSNPNTGVFLVDEGELYRETVPNGTTIENRIMACNAPPSGTWTAPDASFDRPVALVQESDFPFMHRCANDDITTLWMADEDGDTVAAWRQDPSNLLHLCHGEPTPVGFIPWLDPSEQDCAPFEADKHTVLAPFHHLDRDGDGAHDLMPSGESGICGGNRVLHGDDCDDGNASSQTVANHLHVDPLRLTTAMETCVRGEVIIDGSLGADFAWDGVVMPADSELEIRAENGGDCGFQGCVDDALTVRGSPTFRDLGFRGNVTVEPGSDAQFVNVDFHGGIEIQTDADAELRDSHVWIEGEGVQVLTDGTLHAQGTLWSGSASAQPGLLVTNTGVAALQGSIFDTVNVAIELQGGVLDAHELYIGGAATALTVDTGALATCEMCTFDMHRTNNLVVTDGFLDLRDPQFPHANGLSAMIDVQAAGTLSVRSAWVQSAPRTFVHVAGGVATLDGLTVDDFRSTFPLVDVGPDGRAYVTGADLDVHVGGLVKPLFQVFDGQLDVDGVITYPVGPADGLAQILSANSGRVTMRNLNTIGANTFGATEADGRSAIDAEASVVQIENWVHASASVGGRGRVVTATGHSLVEIENAFLVNMEGVFSTDGSTTVLMDTELIGSGDAGDAVFRTREHAGTAGAIVLDHVRAFHTEGSGGLVNVDEGSFTAVRSLLVSDDGGMTVTDGVINLTSSTVATTGGLEVFGNFGEFHVSRSILDVDGATTTPHGHCVIGGTNGQFHERVSIWDSWVPDLAFASPQGVDCQLTFHGGHNVHFPAQGDWTFAHDVPDDPFLRDTYGEVHQ